MRGLPMFAVAGLQSVVGLSPWGRRVKCWSSRPVSESAQQTAAFLANPDLTLSRQSMSHLRQVFGNKVTERETAAPGDIPDDKVTLT